MSDSGEPRIRMCVSCGRSIAWDANVCSYCGHDYRVQMAPVAVEPRISEGMKILFYILSFLFFLAGIIIGVVYYTKNDPESKHVGKMCIILAALGVLVEAIFAIIIWGLLLIAI